MELHPTFLLLLLACFAQVTLCMDFDKLDFWRHNGRVHGPKGQDFSVQLLPDGCDPELTGFEISDKLCAEGQHIKSYRECDRAAESLGTDFYFASEVAKCYAADIVEDNSSGRKFESPREICHTSSSTTPTTTSTSAPTDAQIKTGMNCPCLLKCHSKQGSQKEKCKKKCFKKCEKREKQRF